MDKNVELIEGGLVCDNKNCDWQDMLISFSEYKEWLNKPCPKCGENVLTEQDLQNAEAMHLAVSLLNNMTEEEINSFAENIDIEKLKDSDFFKDAGGLELLSSKGNVSMTVQTHKEIKAVELKKVNDNEGS